MSKQQVNLFILILLLLIWPSTVEGQAVKPVRMEGSIFAVPSRISDPRFILDQINQQTIYVRVVNVGGEDVPERIVKLRYFFESTKRELPKEMFEPDSKWSFLARRNPDCDEEIENWHENERVEIIDLDQKVSQKGPSECFQLINFEKLKIPG
jgi:hypothetical protein